MDPDASPNTGVPGERPEALPTLLSTTTPAQSDPGAPAATRSKNGNSTICVKTIRHRLNSCSTEVAGTGTLRRFP
eukprot:scaffold59586_cov17-Tisochrysis_lutea.AAC.1